MFRLVQHNTNVLLGERLQEETKEMCCCSCVYFVVRVLWGVLFCFVVVCLLLFSVGVFLLAGMH